eukprot:RCo035465
MFRLARVLCETAKTHFVPVLYSPRIAEKVRNRTSHMLPVEDIHLGNLVGNQGRRKKRRYGVGKSSARAGPLGGHGRMIRKLGYRHRSFEGGQMPLVKRLPKIVPQPIFFEEQMKEITLGDLQAWADQGRLDPTQVITPRYLLLSGMLHALPKWPGIRLTAHGYAIFNLKLDVRLNWVDEEAVSVIRARGGTVLSVYMDPATYFYQKRPANDPDLVPKLPPPQIWARYTRPEIAGYLVGREDLFQALQKSYRFQWTPALTQQK